VGLDLRIAFRWDDRGFVLLYCGTHDEIQSWIRNTR
jgi:hypothetical protein